MWSIKLNHFFLISTWHYNVSWEENCGRDNAELIHRVKTFSSSAYFFSSFGKLNIKFYLMSSPSSQFSFHSAARWCRVERERESERRKSLLNIWMIGGRSKWRKKSIFIKKCHLLLESNLKSEGRKNCQHQHANKLTRHTETCRDWDWLKIIKKLNLTLNSILWREPPSSVEINSLL